MHRFLRYWEQQGQGRRLQAQVINYADDFVILSRGHAGEALEHDVLHRGNVDPWAEVVERANRILRGWANYFCYGTLSKAYRAIDNYVYHRAIRMLSKRHKGSSRGTRKFPGTKVFGELGIQRLRSLRALRRSRALA